MNTDKLLQSIDLKDSNYVKEKSKISCFDFHHRNKFYLIGSYSGKIYSMDYLSNKTIFSVDGKHKNGVNILKFLNRPENSLNFLSGGRRDNEIFLWDIRNITQPLFSFYRENQTNQKLNFVVDDNDNFLFVANNDGTVIVYDLKNFNTISYFYTGEIKGKDTKAVSCLDFNSKINCLVTANGSRDNNHNRFEKSLDADRINLESEEEGLNMHDHFDGGFKFWDFNSLNGIGEK